MEALLVIVAVLLVAILGVVAGQRPRVHRFAGRIRPSAIVNLTTDKAFRGVLYETRGDTLVMKQAELHAAGQWKPVDGEVVIDRSKVDFVQIIARAEA